MDKNVGVCEMAIDLVRRIYLDNLKLLAENGQMPRQNGGWIVWL